MTQNPVRGTSRGDDLKTAIAAAAARWIAEEGCDYATAKRRGAREVLGDAGGVGAMPDNPLVESELRRYPWAARRKRMRAMVPVWLEEGWFPP